MTVVIYILIGLFSVSLVARSIAKNTARIKGQQKCAFCGAHLKRAGGGNLGYASHCAKCGRQQPWA